MARKSKNAYSSIVLEIFRTHYKKGAKDFIFLRDEIEDTAEKLGLARPKNLGDVIYTFRYRRSLPKEITATAPSGFEWIIEGAGDATYRFRLAKISRIVPRENSYEIKIPDATPEIISKYALTDEQALLAIVRYNRLVDIFLGLTAYSLQNHLRTKVPEIGQIEVDEIYIGIKNTGQQFVIPIQAKGGTDQLGSVQIRQDIALCRSSFPRLTARPVAVQFKSDTEGEVIVMFELVEDGENIKVIDEKHYRLVPSESISDEDLETMARS